VVSVVLVDLAILVVLVDLAMLVVLADKEDLLDLLDLVHQFKSKISSEAIRYRHSHYWIQS
jgi:hypothetical protein